jgi:hypothetical protein
MQCSHPYNPGTEFVLILTTPPSTPESTEPNIGAHVRVKVIHTYKFTRSQTMKVEILATSGGYPLPTHAILKLYDHRYLGDRVGEDAKNPWGVEREAKAERIRKLLEEPPTGFRLPSEGLELAILSSDTPNPPAEEDASSKEEVEENKYYRILVNTLKQVSSSDLSQWKTENWYRSDTERLFSTETEAYAQLHPLQGHCIPTFYGETEFDETCAQAEGVDTYVRGILVEFIEGSLLEEIEVDSPIAVANPHIGQRIFDLFRKIAELGILHNDVRPANVMVRNDGRVFLIDFAQAIFRGDKNFSANHWAERVRAWGELDIMARMLDEKQLRDITPPAPSPDSARGYSSLWEYNKKVGRGRETWREKYYRPAGSEDHYEWACARDKDGVKGILDFPEWYLIEEMARERKEILDSFRDLTLDNL